MNGFLNFIKSLGPSRILAMGVVTAGLIGFFVFVTLRVMEPQYGLLYSNLDLAESSTITQRLDSSGVPYQLGDDGRSIFVPSSQIASLRVSMAGEGLGGNIVGYEIFDRSDGLGTTSFVQNINRVRAIEGELSRTIREINAVATARVHIVMPERQLFSQTEREPSASIVLRTTGPGLTQQQIMAIQNLVASAVPNLDVRRISIIDQRGSLLASGTAPSEETPFATTLDERRRVTEDRLRRQIESLLESTVGPGKVRAEVSVDMNLNRVTTSSETYDPDSQVVRSTQTVEETTTDSESTANEPVTVANNLPDAQLQQPEPDTSNSSTSRSEETTNFEISRTQTTEIREGGEIERISVGVLVDGDYVAAADGTVTYQPRPQAELDQLAVLVQSAIGFDAGRGDRIQVVNLQFAQPEEAAPLPDQFDLFGLTADDLTRMAESLMWILLAVLVLFVIVRPLVNKIINFIPDAPPPSEKQIEKPEQPVAAIAGPKGEITPELADAAAHGDQDALKAIAEARAAAPSKPVPHLGVETMIDVAQVEGRVKESALKKVGDIVMRHPEESAAIVRQWLYSD